MSPSENEKNDHDSSDYSRYTIQIGNHFSERIDRHITLLKLIEKNELHKQSWLIKAIDEKLKKDEAIPVDSLPKEKHLSLKMTKGLRNRIERIVKALKTVRRTYSTKQWIVEAISEKLSEEEEFVKQKAREDLNSTSFDSLQ